MPKNSCAIYIHWPFCKKKCPYCDFNSHVSRTIDHQAWLNSYIKELEFYKDYLVDKNITSIFFGGGTPSLMEVNIPAEIINYIKKNFKFSNELEITLEANPTSIETEKFKSLSENGINRVSIGVQSFRNNDLKFLGREHSANEAFNALEIADKYFKNYSFDLIYSLPNQDLNHWQEDLEQAVKLAKYHISLYQLTIEKGTKFYSQYQNKEFKMPDEEKSADFFEFTHNFMQNNSFENYEISNFCKDGFESKHNMQYWLYQDYLGIGPGAHGRITKDKTVISTMNFHRPDIYLKQINDNGHALQIETPLSNKTIIQEKIMMGLRLKNGIDASSLVNHLDLQKLNQLLNEDILNFDNNIIKIPQNKKLLTNAIITKLIEACKF